MADSRNDYGESNNFNMPQAGPSSSSSSSNPAYSQSSTPQNSDRGLLDSESRWANEEGRRDTVRTSKMMGKFGVSPPPPGPPPSEPPPLPPASTHPYSSSNFGKAASRLSNVAHFRKPSLSKNNQSLNHSHPHPAEPALPPPSAALPALPSSVTGHIRNASSSSRTSSKRLSNSPPTSPTTGSVPRVSPRSSSLLSPQQLTHIQDPGPSASSSTSPPTLLARPAKPTRTPSRHLLQTALDLAQRAVEMDKTNDVQGALAAYREAVSRLKNVMERVGVEPREDGKKRRSTGRTEEEGRTLRGIHDAYVARIQLLSSYREDENDGLGDAEEEEYDVPLSHTSPTIPSPIATIDREHDFQYGQSSNPVSSSTATLVPGGGAVHQSPLSETTTTSGERTPRPSLDDTATGIGNVMLSDPGDSTLDTISPVRPTHNLSSPFSSRPPATARTTSLQSVHTIQDEQSDTMPQSLLQQPRLGVETPIVPPPRRTSIGVTGPTSPSTHLASPVVGTSSRPNSRGHSQVVSPPHPSSATGSSSTSSSRIPRQLPKQSLGIESEIEEEAFKEEHEDMEVLTRTPQHTAQSLASSDGTMGKSGQLVQAQMSDRRGSGMSTGEKTLPALPHSAPNSSAVPASHPQSAQTQPRQQGIGIGRPSSGSYLVSPSVAQGTISQRRRSKGLESGSDPNRHMQDIDGLPPTSTSTTPFPANPSLSTQSPPSVFPPRSRARSQPGSAKEDDYVPPLPSTIRHKGSFSSTLHSRVISASGVTPPGREGGLRINTDTAAGSSLTLPGGATASGLSSRSSNRTSPGSIPHSVSGQLISPLPDPQPTELAHRPFHLLRGLCLSMDPESSGYYLTGSIHIDANVWKLPAKWTQGYGKPIGPPKIASQDLKVRIMESLIMHLEVVKQTGLQLLDGPREYKRGNVPISVTGHNSRIAGVAEDLCSALDGMDEEMDQSYKSLAKVGVHVGRWKGKGKKASNLSWGSRFTKTMDKMTSSKVFDAPDTYVDLLSNFCFTVQVLEEHLHSLTGNCTRAYASLPDKSFRAVESRILSAAQFVGVVIVPFIMDDLKQFMERYMKCGARWAENPMVM